MLSYSLLAFLTIGLLTGCVDVSNEPVPIVTAPAVPSDYPTVPGEPMETEEPPVDVLPEPEPEFAQLYCGIVENEGQVTVADVEFAEAYADKVASGNIPGGELIENDIRTFASQIQASIDTNEGQLFYSSLQTAVDACDSVS